MRPNPLNNDPATQAETARLSNYAKWRAFADGDQSPANGSRDRESQTVVSFTFGGRQYPAMILNYARTLVRKTISYTLSDTVTFNITDAGDAPPVEKILADELRRMNAAELDFQIALEAATIGDAAIRVTWSAGEGIILAQIDPASLTVDTDPRRPDHITQLRHSYQCTMAQLPAGWVDTSTVISTADELVTVEEVWTDDTVQISVNEQLMAPQENTYGWIPYVLLANERSPRSPWGCSDLVDLETICREINREMTVQARLMEISGWPIAVVENTEPGGNLTVGPGKVWELPEGAKAYVLDLLTQGGAAAHDNYASLLYRILHDVSETPRTSFGDSGRALSGVALEVEIQPLVQKVHRKRTALDRFYAGRNYRILDLLERFGSAAIGGARQTQPIWPAILPTDQTEEIKNAVLLNGAHVISTRTALVRIGVADPDEELAELAKETPTDGQLGNTGNADNRSGNGGRDPGTQTSRSA